MVLERKRAQQVKCKFEGENRDSKR